MKRRLLLGLGGVALLAVGCFDWGGAEDTFCENNPQVTACGGGLDGGTGGGGGAGGGGAGGGGAGGGGAGGGGGGGGVADAGAEDDAGVDAGADGGVLDAGGPQCDPSEAVDPSAVFVSATAANDLTTVATPMDPAKTIGRGLAIARARDAGVLYLDKGSYTENLLIPEGPPLRLRGGWGKSGFTWVRDCTPNRRGLTSLLTAPPVGIDVRSPAPGSSLEDVSVAMTAVPTAGADQPGGSSLVVLVRGGAFTLTNVELVASDATGGGAAPSPADPGPLSCAGTPTTCGDGGLGVDRLTPASSSDGGVFTSAGFVPGDGAQGQAGGDGQHGTPGTLGSTATGCYGGCSCSTNNCDNNGTQGSVTAESGRCGCGGRGGLPGAPGRGGGASVALLATDGAQVVVTSSALRAGNGGAGSPGTASRAGTPGMGRPGLNSTCTTQACVMTTACSTGSGACYPGGNMAYVPNTVFGGASGGPGGRGGLGQPGGGGAGGPSHAIVRVGAATVSVDGSSTLTVTTGGMGASGAAAGQTAPVGTY